MIAESNAQLWDLMTMASRSRQNQNVAFFEGLVWITTLHSTGAMGQYHLGGDLDGSISLEYWI
jgi:hypothetical protein